MSDRLKEGDWILGTKTGRIGRITKVQTQDINYRYRIKYLDGGRWIGSAVDRGIEARVAVITKEVADILIALQTI